jgi:HTH-type transcriptional regulator/antitoxin HipB
MSNDAVRDAGGRRFPAHLDTRYGDEGWWHGPERYSRAQPWYTFDRLRYTRDLWRGRTGTPDDHQLPQPGDSPQERKETRRRAAWLREQERRRRVRQDAPWQPLVEAFTCECPPACEELDDHEGMPVHAPDCPCLCDVG